jgi:olefin beta-lactone synthetase
MSHNVNIACRLESQAAEQAHRRAVVEPCASKAQNSSRTYRQLTFLQLEELASSYADAFSRSGIDKGMRVLIGLQPGVDLCAVSFGLFKLGAIPVFIDPGMGKTHLLNCVTKAQATALVGFPKVFVAALLNAQAFKSVKIKISVGVCWLPGVNNLHKLKKRRGFFPAVELNDDDIAALLFTSGSTGPAKGVVYTQKIFNFQIDVIKDQYGVTKDDVDMSVFPLFALFAISMGMTTVIPDMDTSCPAAAKPKRVLRVMEDQGVTFSFGSPAFWKVMADYCEKKNKKLISVRALVMAGCSVEPALHRRFLNGILPEGADIFVPYGATESLPLCSMKGTDVIGFSASRSENGAGTCVGKVMSDDVTVKVIRITDEAIANWDESLELQTGEIGEIVNCGPITTREYYDAPEANEKSKIIDGEKVWHRMGDLGYFDEEGYLWFCGRKNERVQTVDKMLCTDPLENIFNTHEEVMRSALVGVGADVNAEKVVLVVEPQDTGLLNDEPARNALIQDLLKLADSRDDCCLITDVLVRSNFPVDVRHNAKIKRDILRDWAQAELA